MWPPPLTIKGKRQISGTHRTCEHASLPSPAQAVVTHTDCDLSGEGKSGDCSSRSKTCKSHTTSEGLSLNFSFRNNFRLIKSCQGTALVVQWLGVFFLTQGTRVQSLVGELSFQKPEGSWNHVSQLLAHAPAHLNQSSCKSKRGSWVPQLRPDASNK